MIKTENNTDFARSDLAYERKSVLPNTDNDWLLAHGIVYGEDLEEGVQVASLEVLTDEGSSLIGKPKGKYITAFCGKLRSLDDDGMRRVRALIAKYIREFARALIGEELSSEHGVMVVGLGNRDITSDAIGPMTTDKMTVTRHIKDADASLWGNLGMCEVSAISPGVLGQTGIETVELIRGAAKSVSPALVIVIDALAARSLDRLACTVQLSDTGIEPGSGIGNRRKAIKRETVGFPVISIGVPTVVDSSTLVYDALARAGIDEISDELSAVLEGGRGFFVSPKDSDVICDEISTLLSESIDLAMSV